MAYPAPGLRFGEPRTMALLACLCCFQHLFAGLTNRTLRELIAGLIPGYSARQMTYDLRRLRRKRFIQRIPRTHRYELTSEGRRLAVFFTKTYTRIVNPSLAELDPALPPDIADSLATRQNVASVRARPRGPNPGGRYRGLKDDSFVNPSTA